MAKVAAHIVKQKSDYATQQFLANPTISNADVNARVRLWSMANFRELGDTQFGLNADDLRDARVKSLRITVRDQQHRIDSLQAEVEDRTAAQDRAEDKLAMTLEQLAYAEQRLAETELKHSMAEAELWTEKKGFFRRLFRRA